MQGGKLTKIELPLPNVFNRTRNETKLSNILYQQIGVKVKEEEKIKNS